MSAGHLDQERLLALGLGEAPSPAEAQHLAGCASCAAAPAEDAALWARLRQLPVPSPPPQLAAGALARYRRARAVRHRPREIVLGSLLGLALLLVVVAWLRGVAPGALVSLALWLPRWSDLVPRGIGWTTILAVVVPLMAAAAGILLAGVGVFLRRLTALAPK